MSKRQYDGSPIDITWNNGPWANDGETVDATDNKSGEIQTTMQSKPQELDNRSKVATFVRKKLLNGKTVYDLSDDYSYSTVRRAAKGIEAFEGVNAEVPPLESIGSGRESEWVIADSEQHITATKDNNDTTTTDTEPPTYHPPERDTNTKRLAVGVAIVALVSYVLGKLRGGQ